MNDQQLLDALRAVHWEIVDATRETLRQKSADDLARVARTTAGDHVYVLDDCIERVLVDALERHVGPLGIFDIIAEGLGESERLRIPSGSSAGTADRTLIIDPIDGTRGLMYDKRSAWILTGSTSVPVERATLEDIDLAVQTELPTTRAALADQLWALKGKGAHGVTRHLEKGTDEPFCPCPSTASTVDGGFSTIARFFPPGRDVLARIDERLLESVLGAADGPATVFEDQYISSGGQLYQLLTGRDRFVADVRALLFDARERDGHPRGHDCHPYDMCTVLIAREAGVIVTGVTRPDLHHPLDTVTPVAWAGFANESLRQAMESELLAILRDEGLA